MNAALAPRPSFADAPRSTISLASRLASGAPVAAIVTIALAMLMRTLITPPAVEVEPPAAKPVVEVVSSIVDTDPGVRPPPEAPKEITTPPVTPISPVKPLDPPAGPGIGAGPGVGTGGPGVGEGGVNPVFQTGLQLISSIPPEYPAALQARGVEGDCVVTFDVDAAGYTQNVRAGACDHSDFARATERAVAKFRYMPRQGAFGAEPVYDLSFAFAFRLND